MKKDTSLAPIRWLKNEFVNINFPEYQREPNVWSRDAKQRLIDSIVREFDIASLYFYEDVDGSVDCIDGRQRIGAIMSFLGENPEDDDNGFKLKFSNEIYEDDPDRRFIALDGMTFEEVSQLAENDDEEAIQFLQQLMDEYQLTLVMLSESNEPEEFNLQFTRLNLGTIINSGEKLHAMVGELREACFDPEEGLGAHEFLDATSIPTRRYAREQVAAQIVAQVFSLRDPDSQDFTRTRHFDLQRLFKRYSYRAPDFVGQ